VTTAVLVRLFLFLMLTICIVPLSKSCQTKAQLSPIETMRHNQIVMMMLDDDANVEVGVQVIQ
jgi:hypothetical protein